MRHVRRAALLLALAAPARVATAQERALGGGASYGGPLGAAVMGELLYGLKVDVHEDKEQVKARAGLLVQLHAGAGGGKVSLGVGARAGLHSDDFRGSAAAGLKLSLARTWGSSPGDHLPRPGAGPLGHARRLEPGAALSRRRRRGLGGGLLLGSRRPVLEPADQRLARNGKAGPVFDRSGLAWGRVPAQPACTGVRSGSPPGTPSACATGRDAAACAAPWPRSAGCARG